MQQAEDALNPLDLRFGEVLRARREAVGMSINALADAVGIDRGNFSRIETGKRRPPELHYVLRIADALGTRPGDGQFALFVRRAEEERHRGQPSRFALMQMLPDESLPGLREEIVQCDTRQEMAGNVSEQILIGRADEVAVRSVKGDITRFRLDNPMSDLLPPYKRYNELGLAGRLDDLVLYVAKDYGNANFVDLERALTPFVEVKGQTKLLAGPNLVIWNRCGEKFADLIVSMVKRKRLFVHHNRNMCLPWKLPEAKQPFTRNYKRPHGLSVSLYPEPIEGARILELTKKFDGDGPTV